MILRYILIRISENYNGKEPSNDERLRLRSEYIKEECMAQAVRYEFGKLRPKFQTNDCIQLVANCGIRESDGTIYKFAAEGIVGLNIKMNPEEICNYSDNNLKEYFLQLYERAVKIYQNVKNVDMSKILEAIDNVRKNDYKSEQVIFKKKMAKGIQVCITVKFELEKTVVNVQFFENKKEVNSYEIFKTDNNFYVYDILKGENYRVISENEVNYDLSIWNDEKHDVDYYTVVLKSDGNKAVIIDKDNKELDYDYIKKMKNFN